MSIPPPTVGWLIGVMIELPGERSPVRHYFAVGKDDRARAEWAAVDAATRLGSVAVSPVDGVEPVGAVSPLSAPTARNAGLKPGEVRSLGVRWPRRWIAPG